MKNIVKIITEVLTDFYNDWSSEPSIADKYYEKIITPQQTKSNVEGEISGELIGYVDKFGRQNLGYKIPVYKNPSNLDGFGKFVRGVLLNNGDFYLATSENTFHENILSLLAEKGIISFSSQFEYNEKHPEEFVAVIRVSDKKNFTQSTAYDEFPLYYREIFDVANKKHPYSFTVLEYSGY